MFHFDLNVIVQTAGYLGLFAIIFAESGLLIGFFLPGDSLLFTAGFLASQGYFRIEVLMILLFLAAFAGDTVGYFFGQKVGPRVFSRPKSFWFNPKNVKRTEDFFARYGTKAIVLARFIPIVRTFTPIMAGVGKMEYKTFALYNALGAMIWAVGIPLVGYIFGNTIPGADKYVLPTVFFIVIISFLPPAWHYYKDQRKKKEKDLI
jgi:membrane-associated protein